LTDGYAGDGATSSEAIRSLADHLERNVPDDNSVPLTATSTVYVDLVNGRLRATLGDKTGDGNSIPECLRSLAASIENK